MTELAAALDDVARWVGYIVMVTFAMGVLAWVLGLADNARRQTADARLERRAANRRAAHDHDWPYGEDAA